MKTTMKDVAAVANVSHQTVSRIINNSGYVKEETRRRVEAAIDKLQYYPDINARNLKANSCNVVGVTIPNDMEATKNNLFYVQIIAQISAVCKQHGYSLNVVSFDIYTDSVKELIRLNRQNVMSGVIITSPAINGEGLKELRESGLPAVFIGTPPVTDGVGYVDNCSTKLIGDAIDYLFGLGHRRIGFINGPMHMTMSRDFMSGYVDGIKRHQLVYSQDITRSVQLHVAEGALALEKIRMLHPDVTAVLCADDALTIGAMRAGFKMGLRIPDDLSLLSLSYSDWNAYTFPPLTGYRKNYDLLGNHAIHMIMDILNDKAVKPVTVPHILVEGKTCGEVPILK